MKELTIQQVRYAIKQGAQNIKTQFELSTLVTCSYDDFQYCCIDRIFTCDDFTLSMFCYVSLDKYQGRLVANSIDLQVDNIALNIDAADTVSLLDEDGNRINHVVLASEYVFKEQMLHSELSDLNVDVVNRLLDQVIPYNKEGGYCAASQPQSQTRPFNSTDSEIPW